MAEAGMKEMAEKEAELADARAALADARAALVEYENYEFNPAAYNRYVKEMSTKNSVFEEELCALKAEMKEMKAEHAAALAPYEWVVNRTVGLKDVLKKFKGKR
jgi:multidrug resistance efflux pump